MSQFFIYSITGHLRHLYDTSSMNIHQHHCIAKCKQRFDNWHFPKYLNMHLLFVGRLLKNASSSSSRNTQSTAFPNAQRIIPIDNRPKNIHLEKVKQAEVRISQPVFNPYKQQQQQQHQRGQQNGKLFKKSLAQTDEVRLLFVFLFQISISTAKCLRGLRCWRWSNRVWNTRRIPCKCQTSSKWI